MRFTLLVVALLSAVALAAPAPLPLDSSVQTILLDSPTAPDIDATHINLAQRVSSVIATFKRSVRSNTAGATKSKSLKKKGYYIDFAAQLSRARVARNQVSARPGPSAQATAAAAAGGPSASRAGPSAMASAQAAGPSARPSAQFSAHAAGPSAQATARPANAGPSPAPSQQAAAKRDLSFRDFQKAAPWESLDDSVLCPAGESACPIFPRNSSYECVDTEYELTSCGGCASIGEGVDCTAIKGAQGVTCSAGVCLVFSCQVNYKLVADNEDVNSCQKSIN